MARTFNLAHATTFKTPMDNTINFVPNPDQATPQDTHAYQAHMGSANYTTTITLTLRVLQIS
jgi:hypothetical protein